MAKYRITGPDGGTYEITAPDDATEDQVLAYAQSQHQQASKPKGKDRSAMSLQERYAAQGIKPKTSVTGGIGENLAAGFGASYVDLKDSAHQLVANQANRVIKDTVGILGANGPIGTLLNDSVEQYQQSVQKGIDERKVRDAPLKRTGAGMTGGALGSVSQLLLPGTILKGASKVPALSGASPLLSAAGKALLPATLRGTATQGAALGALQPTATGDSRLLNAGLGALGGAAGYGIGKGIGALASLVSQGAKAVMGRPTANALDSRVAEVIRSEADSPANLLKAAPSSVPGVQRSLAEETLDAGVARLERNARSRGQGWDLLDRANNAARIAEIEKFAGDDAAIAAAKAVRDKSSNSLRQQAMKIEGVDTSRLISQVDRLTESFAGRPAVQTGLKQIRELLSRQASGGKAVPEDRVAVLDNVRKTIGDMLSGKYGGDSAASLAGSRELMTIKSQLDRVLQKQAPEYAQYLDAFRQGSKPINRMELGQSLLTSRSGSAILDPVTGKQTLTPAAFSGRARNLDKVAQEATGFRKAKAAGILQPEDLAAIKAVQDDLERRAFAATAGSGGNSQTFERLALNDKLAGGVAGRIPYVGPAVQYLRERGQQRLQARLFEVLQNPEQARAILAKVPEKDRKLLQVALSRTGGYTGSVAPVALEQ